MKKKQSVRMRFRIGLVGAALLLSGVVAADDSALPEVHQSGDVSYLSGGVGQDEIDAIKAVTPKYALALSFIARIDGHDSFSSPEQLVVLKADGSPVLDIKPDGPFLLIDLPVGAYKITAGSAAQSSTQNVQIVRGTHKKLVFRLAGNKTE